MRYPSLKRVLRTAFQGGGVFCVLVVAVMLFEGHRAGGAPWPIGRLAAPEAVPRTEAPAPAATARNGTRAMPAAVALADPLELELDLDRLLMPPALVARPSDRPTFELPWFLESHFSLQGVRYDDPTGGEVPLEWVAAREDRPLTPGFRIRDFMTRDGAPLARISPVLVEGLERMRQRGAQINILSGYRHPSYNAGVGGAGDSQHQAGKAADIWAPTHSPLDLARLALEEMGCAIGLGLGPTSLHVDVRGELETWTYRGAALRGPAFTAWVYMQCGIDVSSELARRAEATWLEEETEDEEETYPAPAREAETDPLARHSAAILASAEAAYPVHGPGVVVIDLRRSAASPAPEYRLAGDPLVAALQLDDLVAWCASRRDGAHFAYAILSDTEAPMTGVMNLAAPPRPTPASRPTVSQAGPGAPGPGASTEGQWGIVVASLPDRAAAQSLVHEYETRLHEHDLGVRLAVSDERYRVVVGLFASRQDAQALMRRIAHVLPPDAWPVEL